MSETRIEIVVSGDNAQATLEQLVAQLPEEAAVVAASDRQIVIADALEQALVASGELPSRVAAWWQVAQAADGVGPLLSLLLCAAIFAAAYGLERAAAALFSRRFVKTEPIQNYSDRFRAAILWGLGQALRLVLFYVLCRAGVIAVAGPGGTMAALASVLFAAVMRFRILVTLVRFLAGATDPSRRLTGLTDHEANHIMRAAYYLLACVAVLVFCREFIVLTVDSGTSGIIFAMTMRAIEGALAITFFFAVRHPIARLIGSSFAPSAAPGSVTGIAVKYWYILYAVLVCLAVATDSYAYLTLKAGSASAASGYSFQVFILTPFLVAGLRLLRDHRVASVSDQQRGTKMGIYALLEGVLILTAAMLILMAWDIDPFASDAAGARRIVPHLVSAALVIVVGVSVWRTVSAFLDVYAPEMPEDDGEIPDGEGGRSGSRLETVFPIFRIASLVLITTVTIMLALAALGVQIGPLIAGAGVIGLAFGFGAQTLVKDVIAGIFYLYEDAFRVGEFIETGEGKGAVEKILLRSARLRHPRGAIFTIPFGSMGTIKNHSRDWVTVKFSFEVAPTEDLERLRKLVKKVGVALAEDPDIGEQFIEPLKSQGAIAMVGPNYQVGVKFTCHPGEQFLIRRKAFAAIQKAISEHGIQLSTPRVVVDSPGDLAMAAAAAISTPPPATS